MSTNKFRFTVARNSISTFSIWRKCVALAVFGAGVLMAADPVACPTDTVAAYVAAFGFGKDVCFINAVTPAGNPVQLTISQFTFAQPGVGLAANQLLVTPVANQFGIGLKITPTVPWTAANQRRVDDEVQYIAKATITAKDWPGIDRLFTEVDGAVTPPGFDQVVEVICPGGTTLPPDQFCPGTNGQALTLFFGPTPPAGTGTSVTFFPPSFSGGNCADFADPVLTMGKPVCVYSSIAVSKDMDANALQGGSATITAVFNQFGRPVCPGNPPPCPVCGPVAFSGPTGSRNEFAALLVDGREGLLTRRPEDVPSLAQ